MLIFFKTILEFSDSNVSIIKKDAELISPGILKSNFLINFGLDNVIKSYLNV